MDFSLIAVDVDGSLANPIMRISVVIFGLILGALLTCAFYFIESRWQRLACAVGIALFGCLSSPFVTRGIGMLLYQFISKPGVSVGFMGSPPFWASSLLAFAFSGLTGLVLGRIRLNKSSLAT